MRSKLVIMGNENNPNRCLLCREAITNPVCYSCIEKGILIWLDETDNALVQELKNISKILSSRLSMQRETKCILCSRKMNICAHCYTRDVFEWLKNVKPELVEEFLDRFNFELKTPYGYLVR